MEITVKVDDSEGAFLVELLRKFSFVHEVKQHQPDPVADQVNLLWKQQASKLFATRTDFSNWLAVPHQTINQSRPIDLLQTDVGSQTVSNLLGRMEHGIMA